MKYGIVTHYDVHNHGALLQLNALVKVLRKNFNVDAFALQYDKSYDFMGRYLKSKYQLSIESIGIYWKYLWERGLCLFIFNIRKKLLFENFKSREKLVGKFYTEYANLDGIVVGSDEVFALHTGPTPVLFGHALPSNKVFSYAGCFGPTTIGDIERLHCSAFVASGLQTMVGLSVRDKNSAEIVKLLTGKDATMVVDPVILYGYEEELAMLTKPNLPPYLLVYAYETRFNAREEVEAIRNYARQKHLRILCAGFYHKWADVNINTDPVDLLRYFKYAECVVTDTFHGAVMAMINEREMAVKIRDNGNKLLNLLGEYGLLTRVIGDDWNLSEIFDKPQNNNRLNEEIKERRRKSMSYLHSIIGI